MTGNRIAFWLGVGAMVMGVVALVDAALEGQGFEATGVVAIVIGLVVAVVARRTEGEERGG